MALHTHVQTHSEIRKIAARAAWIAFCRRDMLCRLGFSTGCRCSRVLPGARSEVGSSSPHANSVKHPRSQILDCAPDRRPSRAGPQRFRRAVGARPAAAAPGTARPARACLTLLRAADAGRHGVHLSRPATLSPLRDRRCWCEPGAGAPSDPRGVAVPRAPVGSAGRPPPAGQTWQVAEAWADSERLPGTSRPRGPALKGSETPRGQRLAPEPAGRQRSHVAG